MNEFTRDEHQWPLEDIRILSRAQGLEYADGRTVEALVAVWNQGTPIHDHQGDYMETIAPTAFDKALNEARPQGKRSTWNVGVLYNHAMTLHGTPSERGSVPIGSPVDIRVEPAGLVTVTRYNKSQLAEDVLEAIRAGDINGHSFSGRFIKSDPQKTPPRGFRASSSGALTMVRRLELGLREYGPTPVPAYAGTEVLSMRTLPPITPEDEEPVDVDTPDDSGAVPDEPPAEPEEALAEHSSRSQELTRHVILQKIARARVTVPGLARPEGES